MVCAVCLTLFLWHNTHGETHLLERCYRGLHFCIPEMDQGIINVTNGLTPQAARPSAGTVLHTQTGSFTFGSNFTDLTT